MPLRPRATRAAAPLRMLLLALVAGSAALTLAACVPDTSSLESLAVYQREQTAEDRLPADLDENVLDTVIPGSTRFLTTVGSTPIYAAKGSPEASPTGEEGVCLVLAGSHPMAGCGGGMPVTVSGLELPDEYALAPRMPEDDGWHEVTDGLWARPK